jgi:hypothetical protein
MVGGTFLQNLVEGKSVSRESGRLGLSSNPAGGQHLWVFFNIVALEGVCGAHAVVVLTGPVNLISLYVCLESGEKETNFICYGSATPGGAIRALVGEAKMARFQPSKHQPR